MSIITDCTSADLRAATTTVRAMKVVTPVTDVAVNGAFLGVALYHTFTGATGLASMYGVLFNYPSALHHAETTSHRAPAGSIGPVPHKTVLVTHLIFAM